MSDIHKHLKQVYLWNVPNECFQISEKMLKFKLNLMTCNNYKVNSTCLFKLKQSFKAV